MEMFTDLQNEISLYAKVFGRAATQQTRLVLCSWHRKTDPHYIRRTQTI